MKIQRVIVIVLDGVGIGAAPDAALYGDEGSNSLVNTASAVGGLRLPNMGALGLGNIMPIAGVPPAAAAGAFGKMQPLSAGKDSVSGHWELMGIRLPKAFPTYPNGFPPEVIAAFSARIGRAVLANKAASGTAIIEEFGAEHMATGKPIVYTSADSVFQIAAHEDIIPVPELYKMCAVAREILVGEHGVGRVIARPFIGSGPGHFQRTERRHDYPLLSVKPTMLDTLVAAGKDVYAVGKIDDLFGGRGITHTAHSANNAQATADFIDKFLPIVFEGLLFVNLVEFDMIYGHRNDAPGYAAALQAFDASLPQIRAALRDDDIVLIAADHGVDPTTPSTDHSREYVPLLVFGAPVRANVNLGTRATFADVAATIAEIFQVQKPEIGVSFLSDILK
ncbi:MAG: phosphopentomutase [Chloroflexi bacterium]|nr:phosphopentomutase [Chloroflexota bacterium]